MACMPVVADLWHQVSLRLLQAEPGVALLSTACRDHQLMQSGACAVESMLDVVVPPLYVLLL
jgi:hypothetical protein